MACGLSREKGTPGCACRHILVVLSQLRSPLFSEQLRTAGKERREADLIFFLAPQWSDIVKERDMKAASTGARRRLADDPSPVQTVLQVVYFLKLRRPRAGRQSVAKSNKCVFGELSEDFSVNFHVPSADPRLGRLHRPPCLRVWLPERRINRRLVTLSQMF